jgi:hypothetical protein
VRTAGIDYDLGRVVLCTVPFEADGPVRFHTKEINNPPSLDLAYRYQNLHYAARVVWQRQHYTVHGAEDEVGSVCVEAPGSGKPSIGLKLYGSFAAVSAATPNYMALCSMTGHEWKHALGLPQKKDAAHAMMREREQWIAQLDQHHLDAYCIALAWKRKQVEHS